MAWATVGVEPGFLARRRRFRQVQALLLKRLGKVTLAQLAEDFDERYRVAMLP
jgi:hypothetical protein